MDWKKIQSNWSLAGNNCAGITGRWVDYAPPPPQQVPVPTTSPPPPPLFALDAQVTMSYFPLTLLRTTFHSKEQQKWQFGSSKVSITAQKTSQVIFFWGTPSSLQLFNSNRKTLRSGFMQVHWNENLDKLQWSSKELSSSCALNYTNGRSTHSQWPRTDRYILDTLTTPASLTPDLIFEHSTTK